MDIDHLISLIRCDFEKKRQKNPQMSLRSYAKRLDVSPGSLSELLLGKRRPGMRLYQRISSKLEVQSSSNHTIDQSGTIILQEDELFAIKDWYHFALVDLLKLKSVRRNPEYLAKRLNISTLKTLTALERLERLGLVSRRGNRWYSTQKLIVSTTDIPSSAIREGFRQDIANCEQAIDDCDLTLRDFSTLTLPFDSSRIDDAKKMLKSFRRDFLKQFSSENADEVYQLSLFLLPLTKPAQESDQ